jgi:transcriptional regulator with XRE-family HTH domain
MDELQATIGAVIRRERRTRGMTLKGLAERAIVSVVYLGEIERGKKYPSPIVLERLASALDLTTPDLLEMIAYTLRGASVVTQAIGFAAPSRATTSMPVGAPNGGGRVVNMLTLVA